MAKDNIILSLIPTLIANFLEPEKALLRENEIMDYDWDFVSKEELDKGDKDRNRPPCPYASDKSKEHRKGCECFINNLDQVPGWKENMEWKDNEDSLR